MGCASCRAKIRKAKRNTPRFIVDNTHTKRGMKNMKHGFTLVVTFSRAWCVRPFFNNLEKIDFDRSKCHLLIYNNTNNVFLDDLLIAKARRYQQFHKQKYGERKQFPPYASVRLFKSFRKIGGTVFGHVPSFDKSKLPVIYEMQRDISGMITTKYFVEIEDDTLPPSYAIKRLLRKLRSNKKIGLVSGIEPTRSPHIEDMARLGVYYLIRPGAIIRERISLDKDLRGFQEIDASGFYLNAIRTEAWQKATKIMIREMEKLKIADPAWAIDTLWTNNVKRSGYRVLCDMETPCLHMQLVSGRIYQWAIDKTVVKLDYYIRKHKIYAQGIPMTQSIK